MTKMLFKETITVRTATHAEAEREAQLLTSKGYCNAIITELWNRTGYIVTAEKRR